MRRVIGFRYHRGAMLDLYPRFAPFFPIGDGLVRLEVVKLSPPIADHPERATIVVQLFVFAEREGEREIRDIKEQQIFAGYASHYDDAGRVEEMLRAQQDVLGELFCQPPERFDALMPHDLLFTNVISLVRARTRDQFARALRVKSRLGRYLKA